MQFPVLRAMLVSTSILLIPPLSHAQPTTAVNGLTFTISADTEPSYYVTSGGSVNIVAGGNLSPYRGFTEFDLKDASLAQHVELSFQFVVNHDDIRPSTVEVAAFIGDNKIPNNYNSHGQSDPVTIERLRPYSTMFWGQTGKSTTFQSNDYDVGDTISLDVTDWFNTAVTRGDAAFGIRLADLSGSGGFQRYLVYGPFTIEVTAIPEPGTYALFGVGLALVGAVAHKRNRQATAS